MSSGAYDIAPVTASLRVAGLAQGWPGADRLPSARRSS